MDTESKIIKQKPEVFVKSITFNDDTMIEFYRSDIVVFTGANNAGKSQVLRDILQRLQTGSKKNAPIIKSLDSDFTGNIEEFLANTKQNNNGDYWTGTGYQHESNIKRWWTSKELQSGMSESFINFLNTEQRLISSNPSNQFNRRTEEPTYPIQKLYSDDEKETRISAYFHQAFGKGLIVDRCGGNNIPLIVGNKPVLQDGEDRNSKSYLNQLDLLPTLQEQGDGMRSFAGIILDTFTSDHTITLIDEPEAFLHPPQARLLGKMLAKNMPNNRQLFISTHSEDFLKGLLDADNENIKIIRINREENINHMNILNNEDIKLLWKDPILRYSNILSGLFHAKVVICESDTDCRFYQAIMNSLYDEENEISPDILFTHCGGKQRLKTVITALESLNVKIITIADIDVLNDKTIFKDIIESLKISWNEIESKWKVIDNYVKQQRAQLDTINVKKDIQEILESVTEDSFPESDSEKIKKVLKQSTAWSKIKEVGKNFFKGDVYKEFNEIDEICCTKGLFIVPVGELECFYRPSSNHGTKWVNEVLEKVDLKTDAELSDAREFVKKIRCK
jgi:predicted ATP-dependent endonuclease of OLD family